MKPISFVAAAFFIALLTLISLASATTIKPSPKNDPLGPDEAIQMDVKGSHGTILREGADYFLLVTLKSASRQNTKKLPLNIAIVIDRSGSMADKGKLSYAKEAARNLVEKLDPEDRVSIVEYDEQITVLAEPVLAGANRQELLRKISLLEPRGSTNLAGGMMEGAKQIEKFVEEKRIHRVLLLSDGLANTGVSTIPEVAALAEGLARKGIQVTCFGLGADFDEEMLTRIADVSGGNYYFIESSAQIASIFEKERRALTTVVAKDVELTLTLPDEVEVKDVYGYAFKKRGSTVVLPLPDIFSGQNRKIVLRLVPSIKERSSITVASVSFDYKSVADDLKKVNDTQSLTLPVTNDRKVFDQSANADVVVEATKTASAKTLEEAMQNYSSGNTAGASSLLGAAKSLLQKTYQAHPSPALVNQMEEMDRAQSGMGAQAPDSEEGKLFIKEKKSDARETQQH